MSIEFVPVRLLDGFPEPVLLLEKDRVLYYNQAAALVFPALASVGPIPEALWELLPEEGGAVATLPVGKETWRVSMSPMPEGNLVVLRPEAAEYHQLGLERVVTQLRQQTAGLAAALQRMDQGVSEEKYRQYQERANQGLYRLLRLVDHMEFQAEEGGVFRPAPLDLAGLCTQFVREFESAVTPVGYRFRYDTELSSLITEGDDALLRRMLLCLLSNAMYAAGTEKEFGLRLAKRRNRAVLTVWDDGPGVDNEHLELLFGGGEAAPRPGAGLGLGLAAVRKVATLHGGTVMMESRAGQGLRAVVSLPIRESLHLPVRSPGPAFESSGGFAPLMVELSDLLPAFLYGPEDLEG